MAVLDLVVTKAEVGVNRERFLRVVGESTVGPEVEKEVYLRTLCPVAGEEPFRRFECWDVAEDRVWVFTEGFVITKRAGELLEKLADRYGEEVARKKLHEASIREFLWRNYGPEGAGFLEEVRKVRAERKRVDLEKMNEPLRSWLADFFGAELDERRVSLDRVFGRDVLSELADTREVQMSQSMDSFRMGFADLADSPTDFTRRTAGR